MKKVITIVLCLTMLLTLVFSGCGQTAGTQSQQQSTTESSSQQSTAQQSTAQASNQEPPIGNGFPLKEKVTFSVFAAPRGTNNNDLENNEFTKYMEDKTNVHIDWVMTTQQDMGQKLTLMMSSGDYTDIIAQPWWTPSTVLLYGKQGILIPLNDYIDKYAVNLKKMFGLYPTWRSDITMADGNIYCTGTGYLCYHCNVQSKMWVYKPWLDQLGLQMPTTTDEFYNVLKTFKTKDPNGNGKADEIPLAGSLQGWETNPVTFIMNSFIYYPEKGLIVQDGKINSVYDEPQWKEGLAYMNKLVKEGLMAKETFTQDDKQLVAMGTNPNGQILGTAPGGYQDCFSHITDGTDGEWNKWTTIPPLKGPEGVQYARLFVNNQFGGAEWLVTNKCKNPDIAVRYADLFYTGEMTNNQTWGLRGKYWDYVTSGEGIGGGPAKWDFLPAHNDPNAKNYSWNQVGPWGYEPDWHSSKLATNRGANLEALLYDNSKEYYKHAPDSKLLLPGVLAFNEDQSKELGDIEGSINSYVQEMTARFITGDANLNQEWDNYVKKLNDMNLKRWEQLYQEAYDVKMKTPVK